MDPTMIAVMGGLGTQVLAVVALALRLAHRKKRRREETVLHLRITRNGDV